MSQPHVLVVDDEELYRRALERILVRAGYKVACASNASEALAHVHAEPVDLVLADVKMPGINGIELVRQLRELEPELPCIVVTGFADADNSVEALRAGAFWYLEKPFDQGHLDAVRRLVEQAIEHSRLRAENRLLHSQLRTRYRFDNIVGNSPALRRVLDLVEKVADTDSTVLITGESGTGKELVARALHYNSRRAERNLVTLNCGAVPQELLEDELFGHVKGAYTSASGERVGRFAYADGGTLFLDEIGEMSPQLQVKLLRVLQERTFEPVGSSDSISVNVRVVAATNQDLDQAIREKRFREDLYFRLNVIPIEMPALRDRREDIPALVHHFLEKYAGDVPRSINADALDLLCDYTWPGNIRELENVVQRLCVMSGPGAIEVGDLPAEITRQARLPGSGAPRVPATGISFAEEVNRFEADLILQALEQTQWNKNQAAQLLDMNRTTLIEKIKRKRLEPARDDD